MALLDQWFLSQDVTFIERVMMSMVNYCTVIASEGSSVSGHAARKSFSSTVINNPFTYRPNFSIAAAVNAIVINEATSSGSVSISTANSSTQQVLALDGDINNAVAAAFNAFVTNI